MKKFIPIVVVLVVVAGGSFFGGMKYGQSKGTARVGQGNFQNFGNMNVTGTRSGAETRQGANFTAGEITAKDADSITLKLTSGSSKIVFYSASTGIQKSATGTSDDLTVGETVSITGTTNTDGSVTAQSIQLRSVSSLNQP